MFGDKNLTLIGYRDCRDDVYICMFSSFLLWGPKTGVNMYVCDYLSVCVGLYPASCPVSARRGFNVGDLAWDKW